MAGPCCGGQSGWPLGRCMVAPCVLGQRGGQQPGCTPGGCPAGENPPSSWGGPRAHVAKGCPLCPEVEMEVPLLLLLLQQNMRGLSPAVPWPTGGQGQTQPRTWQPQTGCGRWSMTMVRHPPYPWHRLGSSSARTVPSGGPHGSPRTHVVGVERQWMGTTPVPCPEGDTGAGFLAQGEQSQAWGHHRPSCGGAAGRGERVWEVPAPWVLGSRALGGRCAAAGRWHRGSGSASAGGPSARSHASPAAAPTGCPALAPGPPGPSPPAAAL